MAVSSCETCSFFVKEKKGTLLPAQKQDTKGAVGTCHRFPPQWVSVQITPCFIEYVSVHALIASPKDGWCGEHKPMAP